MKKINEVSVYELLESFKKSSFRTTSIPMELRAGWPCVRLIGKTLCITLPYYKAERMNGKYKIYPLYSAVTFPVGNPDRIVDYTIFPYQKEWSGVDYTKGVGYFKHEALSDVKTKDEYEALCKELYKYYDEMIKAVSEKKPFEHEAEMSKLFTKLMEPGQYPLYLKLNKKFYSSFCKLQKADK